ncbi:MULTISPECIES: hypothetical protein [unclassified Nonomuraea]|uniref:hypothetical protein n=1 Tax=unclassified Nonomuraea TaxID=2593643 RepID=UPI0033E5E2DC
MSWAGYRARWRGGDYGASPDLRPDGLWLRLRSGTPAEGFEEVAPGRYVLPVPAARCEDVRFAVTVCSWRGEPFLVLDGRGDELLLEYTGARATVARRLGLERVERGVYRRWVPRDEIADLREESSPL